MREISLNRQKLGLEDLLFGVGIVTQIRAGQTVNVSKINAGNLPFNETQSLLEWAQLINLEVLGSMTTELQAIYDNLPTISVVEDNLTVINTLGTNITALQSLYTNIAKLQNIDTNMSKLQNIDTNMSKLQNLDTNMSKLQAIYIDLTKLESIYDNLTMLTVIYNNLTALNNINSQVIPNLTELLLVNDSAAQVAADKLTVATDKGIVAGYKDAVSAMKVAVETIYDTFDDRFLGVKASDPTLDNDGNALLDGAMYFNGTSHLLKVYSLGNTTWYAIPQLYLSALLDVALVSVVTGDMLTWNGTKWTNTRTPSFDSIKLNGGTGTQGTATWNNTDLTYDLQLNTKVSLQVGQEEVALCKNNTASLITNGRPVMAVGTNGNSGNILIDLHDGTKASARRIVGVATEDIASGATGFVTRCGKVRGLNTTGSTYGETWDNGDILYVKATGNLTNIEPADTALKMPIAFVIHAHTNGTLYVRTTGIDENHDRDFTNNLVNIHSKTAKTTPVDADEIMIADSASTWSLKKITWANIKDTLALLFISKVTSTDNAIVRFDGTTGAVQNSGVIIDDSGNVGIGVTPSAWAGLFKSIDIGRGSLFSIPAANEMGIGDNFYYDIGGAYMYKTSASATYYRQGVGQHTWLTAPSGIAGNPIPWSERMSLGSNGNLLVGTTTDNGVDKLQVNGNISNTRDIATGGGQYNIWSSTPTYEIVNRGNVAKAFQWYVGANGSAPMASLTTSGVWTNASDKRNKTNIKDIPYGLSTVLSLSPKEYDLKSDGTHAIGFIAQDVKEIIPELVFEEKEGAFLTLDYASMVTVLVKAMQEQQAQIEELRLSIEGK